MINKKLWIAAISLMIFLNNDYQKDVKATSLPNHNFNEESRLQLSEDSLMIPTQNNPYGFISKVAMVEELLNNKKLDATPAMVVANELNFYVNDVNDIFSTIWELVEFYGGKEVASSSVNYLTETDKIENIERRVTGMKINGIECRIGTFTGRSLSDSETRNMILYGRSEPEKTIVFDEDSSLWQIANDNGLTEAELYLLNPEIKDLKWVDLIGREIDITPINPLIDIAFETIETYHSTLAYETEYVEDESMLEGQLELLQPGKDGQVLTKFMISTDGVTTIEEIVESKVVNEIIAKGSKMVTDIGTGQWSWPLSSHEISSDYLSDEGQYGIQITASTCETVYAADNGVVEEVVVSGGKTSVLINHKNGYYSRYGNMDQATVKQGEKIEKGQPIGVVGEIENQSRQSLYFEIRTNKGGLNTYAPNPINFF